MSHYQKLTRRFDEIGKLTAAASILSWDSKTMMPASGTDSRGDQLACLSRVLHAQLTDSAVGEHLEGAAGEHDLLDHWQRANLREMRRRWAHAKATPADLNARFAKARIVAAAAWFDAKDRDDFEVFAPDLRVILALLREIAQAKCEHLGLSAYDALLDVHDPGTRSAHLDSIFAGLEAFLPGFARSVQDAQAATPPIPLPAVDAARQLHLIRRILTRIGWPKTGRIDHTEHPFAMSGVPQDPRITTHFDEANPHFALLAAFHEVGHGIYNLNLPKDDSKYQPVSAARGASTHEAQALGVEMQACRSSEFLSWFFPVLREAWGVDGPAWTDENLHAIYRRVEPSLIRVNADEVTYSLHVILRYRLERALLADDLAVDELPNAWDDGMASLLGVRPSGFADGCLQDIHWSMGLIGYFPTYSLGALKAAQFFDAAKRLEPGLLAELGRGNFAPWLGWLAENVHRHASLYESNALLERASGAAVDVEVFKRHLATRYLD